MMLRIVRLLLALIVVARTSFASEPDPFYSDEEVAQMRVEQAQLEHLKEELLLRVWAPPILALVAAGGALWLVGKAFEPPAEVGKARESLEWERRHPGSIAPEAVAKAKVVSAEYDVVVRNRQRLLSFVTPDSVEDMNRRMKYVGWLVTGVIYAVILFFILTPICGWLIFQRAGRSGWSILLPFYNFWVLFEVAGLKGWLSLVPGVNAIVWLLVVPFGLARRFSKPPLFGVGLLALPGFFYPLLAFGLGSYDAGSKRQI